MKRSIVLFLVLGMIFGSIASAEAAKKKKPKKVSRTVEGSYDLPPLVIAGTCSQTGAIGCVAIQTGPTEKYLTAGSVTDQHGQDVLVSVSANTDGATGDDVTFGTFCGEITEPIEFEPGVQLHLWVGAIDPGFAGCPPGAASTGTVSVTLSNRP
jgi:hypothetical protein